MCECTFKYLNNLRCLTHLRHLNCPQEWAQNKSSTTSAFQVFKTDSSVELHIDRETYESATLWKTCLSPVLARPGVSVFD